MVFMGITGYRHRETGKPPRDLLTHYDVATWRPIIENVDAELDDDCRVIPGPYKLRVISLHQPYASLMWVFKRHETLSFPLPPKLIGEQIGVHATLGLPAVIPTELDPLVCDAFGADWRNTLPRGAILGTVVFDDCRPMATAVPWSWEDVCAGDWSLGRYAWRRRLSDRNEWGRWAEPVPMRGQQGFWNTDTDALNAAMVAAGYGETTP